MSTLSRLVALLLGLAVGACQFLPWVGAVPAGKVPLGTLVSPERVTTASWYASLAVPLTVAAVLAVLGALFGNRPLLVLGGLAAIAFPSAWILVNVLTESAALDIAGVGIGAYGAAISGFMLLILAAVAADTRAPSVR